MHITPETRVGMLLDVHPELVDVLVGLAPAFEKLRNPVLRRTVAKLATLEQAARIGGVALPDLLAALRRAMGASETGSETGERSGTPRLPSEAPAWVTSEAIHVEVDAEVLLAEGVHPLEKVRKLLSSLPEGGVLLVRSSFEPAPLLERMAHEGVPTWCTFVEGAFRTYLRRS